MATKLTQLENYKKYLLNRLSAKPAFIDYVETCLSTEDASARHSFHKIMVHNWTESKEQLFTIMSDYFTASFIPVSYSTQGHLCTFYTDNLVLVLKIIRLDFMFPYERNMYNIDVLFNDKSSADLFDNWITIEDIVSGVVSNRLNEHFELNLSMFCSDPEFLEKNICFYKLGLLSNYKILMLRMGRDTNVLNLGKNNLSQVPLEIINFFIKGNLVGINLSDNNIPSLAELHRVSSKIEKLWVEGNPLCDEELDPTSYVKHITMKFPRVTEIDGIKLHESGFPFFKNFLVTPDRKTKMLMEKFISIYFAHFDYKRENVLQFYHEDAILSVAASLDDTKTNILFVKSKEWESFYNVFKYRRTYTPRTCLVNALTHCVPPSEHDPSTFCVDVLHHDKNHLLCTVDGVFRSELRIKRKNISYPTRYFGFRRTFLLNSVLKQNKTTIFYIVNEMIALRTPTKEQIDNSFKYPIKNIATLALVNPEPEQIFTICKAFCNMTHLKKEEAEARLVRVKYDVRQALEFFIYDMNKKKIPENKFAAEDEDMSDISSLSDEID